MDLRALLREHGATEEEIEAAERQGRHELQLLAIDRVILGSPKRYTGKDVAAQVGISEEEAKRYWRALGFVDVPDDEIAFTEADVVALSYAVTAVQAGFASRATTLQVTRVVGQSASRIGAALAALTSQRVQDEVDAGAGVDDVTERTIVEAARLAPMNEAFVAYAYRRHLAAAAKRRIDTAGDPAVRPVAVGFCDLVGFTALARRVEAAALGEIVERFETVAYDVIGANGGRLVKMIGDEVMFVTREPSDAAEIALRLSEEHGLDPEIPDCRIGVAYGPALPREGDYFGETVNLAARIQGVALPKTVLISEAMAQAVADSSRFDVRRIRHRHLKGVGRTRLWVLRRAS